MTETLTDSTVLTVNKSAEIRAERDKIGKEATPVKIRDALAARSIEVGLSQIYSQLKKTKKVQKNVVPNQDGLTRLHNLTKEVGGLKALRDLCEALSKIK